MPNDDAAKTPGSGRRQRYDIVQSASDPNRQWQLIGKDAVGNETCRIGFGTYSDAWNAAERRKSAEDEGRADLLIQVAQPQPFRPIEYKADILTWSERQASLLRRIAAGETVTDQIDWENVIDEVESAGRRQLAEARFLLVRALAAMLKAWAWPRSPELSRWQTERTGLQSEAAGIIVPSMLRRININDLYFKALRRLPKTIDGAEPPMFPVECPVTLDDLLSD
jgi:Domain of unknown function DUF29